ncbi:MAG: hypothetical protein VX299_07530 [Pseudomonadota bacterium]|nr:hypothetical protein [Pseudomonadota bacterium]
MLDRVLRRCLRLLWRLVWRGALGFVVLSVALVLLFRFVPPPGSMVMGSPAKVHRPVNEKDQMMIVGGWTTYKRYAAQYKEMGENLG